MVTTPSPLLSSIFPDEYRVPMKYVEQLLFVGGSSGLLGTEYVFNMNSLFDPNQTGTGHQPYGFDQLTPWFNTYCVEDVELVLTCVAPSSASTYVAMRWRPSVGSYTLSALGIADVAEKDNTRWFPLPSSPANSQAMTYGIGKFSIAAVEGKKRSDILAEGAYQAAPTGNPALMPTFAFAIGDLSGASAVTCAITVQLIYHAVWRGRKTVTGS